MAFVIRPQAKSEVMNRSIV